MAAPSKQDPPSYPENHPSSLKALSDLPQGKVGLVTLFTGQERKTFGPFLIVGLVGSTKSSARFKLWDGTDFMVVHIPIRYVSKHDGFDRSYDYDECHRFFEFLESSPRAILEEIPGGYCIRYRYQAEDR